MNRPPVPRLLLPGMMCDRRLWQPVMERLPPARTVVPVFSGQDTVTAMAGSVLQSVTGPFHLAGLSMGGIVAFEVWRQAPHRVLSMGILCSNARADTPDRAALRDQQCARVRAGELQDLILDTLVPAYFGAGRRPDRDIARMVVDMAVGLGGDVFGNQSRALARRPDSRNTLSQIRCPALLICGEDDAICPVAYHREMAALMPAARLEVLPDCGHLATLEQPAAVAGLLGELFDEAERSVQHDRLQA